MKHGLPISTVQKSLIVLSQHAQVEQAILYGSHAKGNYTKGSDIDLTLLGGPELTLRVLFRILTDLDELSLPYTFDLSKFNDITDPDVIEHIQRVGVTFYTKGEVVAVSV